MKLLISNFKYIDSLTLCNLQYNVNVISNIKHGLNYVTKYILLK